MSHNWSFVIAGYSITGVALAGYLVWVRQKSRSLRRLQREESSD